MLVWILTFYKYFALISFSTTRLLSSLETVPLGSMVGGSPAGLHGRRKSCNLVVCNTDTCVNLVWGLMQLISITTF